MSLFAISDLHLSLFVDKPMDIFDDVWKHHEKKIEENWKKTICENDTVLIPGDISWGLNIDEAKTDLNFINSLPGRKILLSGNHDYWWSSLSKLNLLYPEMFFLQNNCTFYEDFAVCGSRGWKLPTDAGFDASDAKIYRRELIRMRLSLDTAKRRGEKNIIVITHLPPSNAQKADTEFTQLFEEYGVKKVIYGHLHGEENFKTGITGEKNGISYELVSADFLNFIPKKIL